MGGNYQPWNEQTGVASVDQALDPLAQFRALMATAGAGSPAPPPPPAMIAPQAGQQVPGGGLPDMSQMGGGAPPILVPPAPAAAPPPFIPQLPQPDFSSVRQPKPLSTPQVQYYPTRGGARAGNILGALADFREGAQHAQDVQNVRLANIGKMAYQRIQDISQDASLSDDDKKKAISNIVNDPEKQQALRVIGIELPMVKGSQEANAPSGVKGVLGKVMSGITGVPQRPPTGQVDVSQLPQMAPQQRMLMQLQQKKLADAIADQEWLDALPKEAKDLLRMQAHGMVLSGADQQKLYAMQQAAAEQLRQKHQNDLELQAAKDKAAAERQQNAPDKTQPLANEMADLETKVANGTATPADRTRLEAIKKTRTLTQQTTYVLNQQKQGPEQQAIETAARSLANGDLTNLRDISSMRGDQRLLIFARAKELNPKFNTGELARKIKMEDAFTNGQDGKNLQSFGTFLEHAGELSSAIDAVRNSQTASPLINRPLVWLRENAAGDPAIHNLLTAIEPVQKEYETFLLNNRALYAEDRKSVQGIINGTLSPAMMQTALKQVGTTAKDRANEANYRYKRVMGHDLQDPFSPEAISAAQKLGVDLTLGGGGKSIGGFKYYAVNPQTGEKQGSNDGKTWQKIQ